MTQPGIPSSLRLLNAQSIFDVLLGRGELGLTRAEIARATGLSKPTVSGLVAELVDAGIVATVKRDSTEPASRQGTPYTVDENAGFVLGADVGASKITLGVADLIGTIRIERELSTGTNAEAALMQVVSAVEEIQGELGCSISAACAGVPGVYRQAADVVDESLNMPGLHGMRVATRLREALGIEVHVDNDVNLAARGEASTARSPELRDFVAISVGTGIGAGLVLDGELYRGGNDAAGEIGALKIAHAPLLDGEIPTLESLAAAPGIERSFQRALASGFESSLGSPRSAIEILAASEAGDPAAKEATSLAADAMALAITHTSLLINPDWIVFGGEIGSRSSFVNAVSTALGGYTSRPLNIAASTLGGRATFIGATTHAVEWLQGAIVDQRLGTTR